MRNKIQKKFTPGKTASKLLGICIIPITAVFLALTFCFIRDANLSPAHAMLSYPDMFSYIFASILLSFLGGFLLDALEKEKNQKQ